MLFVMNRFAMVEWTDKDVSLRDCERRVLRHATRPAPV